jgi:hypothetical protein
MVGSIPLGMATGHRRIMLLEGFRFKHVKAWKACELWHL